MRTSCPRAEAATPGSQRNRRCRRPAKCGTAPRGPAPRAAARRSDVTHHHRQLDVNELPEPRAGSVDGAAVQLYQSFGKSEAHSKAALARSRCRRPWNMSKMLCSVSGEIPIPSSSMRTCTAPPRPLPTTRCGVRFAVLGRIVQEIREHLGEPYPVSQKKDRLRRQLTGERASAPRSTVWPYRSRSVRSREVDRLLAHGSLPLVIRDTSSKSSTSRTSC